MVKEKETKPEEGVVNPWKGDKPEDPKRKGKHKKETPANEPLHEEDTKPDLTEFTIKKGLNPYGFIHVPKRARASLPFEQGAPLKATIKENALVIRRA